MGKPLYHAESQGDALATLVVNQLRGTLHSGGEGSVLGDLDSMLEDIAFDGRTVTVKTSV